jgi:hypothetical protein
MSNVSRMPQDAPASTATTAHHMADAIGFLMRVAAEAGMRNIVVKLAGIRANLLTLSEQSGPAADNVTEADLEGKSHERNRPH